MKIDSNRMLEHLIGFCKVPTMNSYPGQENKGSEYLYDSLKNSPYFLSNPKDLYFQEIEGDAIKRKNIVAFLESTKKTKRTVVLMGHIDTVDIEVCGDAKDSAFDPEKYTQKLLDMDIPLGVKTELKTGDWLAGRGISDMKSGLSAQWAIMDYFAHHIEELPLNLLWIPVVDEENNAVGIHQSLKLLRKMENEGYEFACCIDSEPTITPENKSLGRIYLGTIGMYTPFALAIGKETHVGEYYEGLSASLMGFHLGISIENNPAFTDNHKGNDYPPICVLRTMDFRKTYSVTVPSRFAMYFDYLFVNKSPKETLDMIKSLAHGAINASLERLALNAKHTPSLTKSNGVIYEYSEIVKMAEKKSGISVTQMLEEYVKDKNVSEVQDNYLMFINYLVDYLHIEGPAFVVGFLPPYCPSRINKRESKEEIAIEESVLEIIESSKTEGTLIELSEVYEGISDLSELGFQGDTDDIESIKGNLLGLGVGFQYNFDEMKKLNIPVANIGPIGKDAHKLTERLYLPYFKDELPKLIWDFIEKLDKKLS